MKNRTAPTDDDDDDDVVKPPTPIDGGDVFVCVPSPSRRSGRLFGLEETLEKKKKTEKNVHRGRNFVFFFHKMKLKIRPSINMKSVVILCQTNQGHLNKTWYHR